MECKILTVSLLLCVLVSYVPGLFGCSDFEPHMRSPNHKEKDEQKVYYSEYVVFGKAGRTRKGPKFPYSNVDGVRTIEFDVTCFYKASAEVPDKIYVTGVGNRRNQIGGCPPAPLEEGQSAVLYLRKLESDGTMMDNMYDIEFAPMSDKNIDDSQKLDDLTLVCGLNRSFPGEQPLPDSERDLSCAQPIDEEYCTAYLPKTTTKAPPKETVTSGMVTDGTTPKKMEPTAETDAGTSKGGDNIGKTISPDDNATYSTETGGSKGPKDGASIQYLSQSLVLTISILFILA